jgi:hypothetical protein
VTLDMEAGRGSRLATRASLVLCAQRTPIWEAEVKISLIALASVILVPVGGCGSTCDLDRRIGGLSIDVSSWITDDPFDVAFESADLSGSFSCGPVVDDARTTVDDNAPAVSGHCSPEAFSLGSNLAIPSVTFTIVQNGASASLELTDVEYVDATEGDDCHEPAPTASRVWPAP